MRKKAKDGRRRRTSHAGRLGEEEDDHEEGDEDDGNVDGEVLPLERGECGRVGVLVEEEDGCGKRQVSLGSLNYRS